jgi:hypothetical protein
MDDPIARHVRRDLVAIGMLRDQERGELGSVLRADLLPMEVALDDGAVVSEEGSPVWEQTLANHDWDSARQRYTPEER